jgi:hypothetical protein
VNRPEVGDSSQELAALTIALRTRVSITLRFTHKVDNVTISFDYCPVWTVATNRRFNFKPAWKFGEVADFIDVVEVLGKLLFNL